MNYQSIDSISELRTPGSENYSPNLGSLIAVTRFGEIFSYGLSQDSRPAIIRSSSDGRVLTNYFDNNENSTWDDFQHIVCNQRGSLIALWSDKNIAFVQTDLVDDPVLKPVLLLKHSTVSIVKAMFHPLFDYVLVVLLQKDRFILYDIRDKNYREQSYQLTDNLAFTSFCFGPDIEWLRFTVFLTTACGKIYALCPVLPNNCCLSKSVTQELLAWVKKQYYALESTYGKFCENKKHLKSYLNQTHEFLLDCASSARPIKFAKDSTLINNHDVGCVGPISIVSSERVKYPQHQVSYCDISVPVFRERNHRKLPVVSLVDSYGYVSVMLLSAKVNTTNIFFPTWRNGGNFFPKPEFLVADRSRLESSDSQKSPVLRLYQDPVNTENVYCCNMSDGIIWLMASSWLASVISKSKGTEIYEVHRAHSMLVGVAISYDPDAGSCMIVKNIDGEVTAINLGVNNKLNELNLNVELSLVDQKANNLRNSAIYTTPIQSPELTRLAEGFRTLPKAISGAGNLFADKKMLVDVCEALELKIVQPIITVSQQLRSHRNKLSVELISQNRLIRGEGTESMLSEKLKPLHDQDANLSSRVRAIISNFESQRKCVRSSLELIKKMRMQMSTAEKCHVQNISKLVEISHELGKELRSLKITKHQNALRPKLQFQINSGANLELESEAKCDVAEIPSTGGSVGISGHTIIAQRYTGLFVNGTGKNLIHSSFDNGIKSPIKSLRATVSPSVRNQYSLAEIAHQFPKAELDICLQAATSNEQQIENAKIELLKLRDRIRNLQSLRFIQ